MSARHPIEPVTHEIRVTGTLLEDARYFCSGGKSQEAILWLEVSASIGLPYIVRQCLGIEEAAHHAAYAKANQLKAGTPVMVHASGARVMPHLGKTSLFLVGVSLVLALNHHPATDPQATTQEA